MSYGIQLLSSNGTVLLEFSDRTIRLAENPQAVTVPSSGTVTVSVTTSANPTNSFAILENGGVASVTSAGVVTLYGSSLSSGNTILRVYLF